MSTTLPDLIDVRRAADIGTILAGRLPLAELPRLVPLLLDSAGEVSYQLRLARDESGRAVVRGEIAAELCLRCERCLEAMTYPVALTLRLAVVAGLDEADELPECYDPLLVGEERLRPRDLIEDELLLGLPQIPRHADDRCANPAGEEGYDPRREHPFAVLAQWRGKH